MARRSKAVVEDYPVDIEENIVDIDVSTEMETSFLEYSYSVIYSRALPDARDGLKPVQRRILYMMDDMRLYPDRGHVKSARVTGEVMGKLHPHGDSAIYDAMVRMAQPFAMSLPLVDGHGNFGSLDDGPAAARYTEVRMAPAATALTANLDEDVVDFVPNYDNQFMQPSVLPAAFPNLLVNGTTGIAVGMATNMAPHNLREVIAATRHLLVNPQANLKEIMKFIPGPDLPTGGTIVGLEGIRDAYETGRGTFKTRAKVSIEQVSARKQGIVITELPYMVGPEKVIEKIKDGVNSKKLTGISDVVDLTDRKNGTRLVVEIKNGFNPQAVLAALYKHTPLEDSFGINNVALVNGQPQTLGLLDLLRVYIDHRLDVVRRRTQFRLTKREDRLHLVEGLLKALLNIDRAIAIIRASEQTAQARTALMDEFSLSEAQANYILELRLRQLTKFSRVELENEHAELLAEIAQLREILDSDQALRMLVSDELEEVAEKYGDDRRTVLKAKDDMQSAIEAAAPSASKAKKSLGLALEIADEPCWVLLTANGLVGRTPGAAMRQELIDPGKRFKHDVYTSIVPTTARGEIGAVTSAGRMLRISVMDIALLETPNGTPNMAAAVKVTELVSLAKGESVIALAPLSKVLALATAGGVIKRVNPDYPLNQVEFEIIKLKDKDSVIGAEVCDLDDDVITLITRDAKLLTFDASKVRPQGRSGGGIAGIKLSEGDTVIALGVTPVGDERAEIVTVTDGKDGLASVKVTALSEYPQKGRATGGVRAHRFLTGENALERAWVGIGPARAGTLGGISRTLPTEHGARDGSGVTLTQSIQTLGPNFAALTKAAALSSDGDSLF